MPKNGCFIFCLLRSMHQNIICNRFFHSKLIMENEKNVFVKTGKSYHFCPSLHSISDAAN